MRVMLSGGLYPGWAQAIMPCSFGLIFIVVSYYFSQKKKDVGDDPSPQDDAGNSRPAALLIAYGNWDIIVAVHDPLGGCA